MKPIYSNDRTAPRMRKAKYAEQVITNELWKEFRKRHPEYKGKSNKELNELWGDLAFTIRQEAITNPLGIKLGSYTGELKLQYIPYKFKADNKIGSEEIGEKINHSNLLTRGKVAKIKWERRWAVRFNKMLNFFAFAATRELEKLAKEHIDKHPEQVRMGRGKQY